MCVLFLFSSPSKVQVLVLVKLLFVGLIFLWFCFLSYSKGLMGSSVSVLRIHVLGGIRSCIFCLDGVICPEPRVFLVRS